MLTFSADKKETVNLDSRGFIEYAAVPCCLRAGPRLLQES